MQIGLLTDGVPDLTLDDVMRTAAELGISMLEFGCGNWSSAPHLDVDALLSSDKARTELLARLKDHALSISALNCSGNPLHPGEHGRAHREVTSKTVRLAGLLGVRRVVMMSGCPGGPGDANANWVTVAWPPEAARVLEWQWTHQLIPYWRNLVQEARSAGVERLCLELHAHQNVYNVATLFRLREAVGAMVGANLDPSHLFWMGADPLQAIPVLGEAIYHVHAKDTRINPVLAGINGLLDITPTEQLPARAWSYVTLGKGHDAGWWRQFCAGLHEAGYTGVLSIEHEEPGVAAIDGIRQSVALLRAALG